MSYKVIHSHKKGRTEGREGGREGKEEGRWDRDGEGGKAGERNRLNGEYIEKVICAHNQT